MQGSAPVLSQRPPGPTLLQHMCTTCKVFPFPQKEFPRPVKMAGGAERGWEHPPLQSENPN